MNSKDYFIIFFLFIIIIIIYYFFIHINNHIKKKKISHLTDKWIDYIVKFRNPKKAAKLFCKDGLLVGTRSHQIRSGKSINEYFEWLSNLPNDVVNRRYNISKVSNNVYLNTAFITWYNKDEKKKIITRMSFVFRNDCLFFIHSSFLPQKNQDLYK